jgi:hypothetical protein
MKYLVVKGWLGFGDRLESLKMAVAYALKYNLAIYVDWTDSIWSHGEETFYTYFKLVNMKILNSLDDIPSDATVYPEFWKDNLKLPITQELTVRPDINLGFLSVEYPSDVVVFSSIGYRTLYSDSSFFANVFRIVHPILLQNKVDLSKTLGIHIRGTDRISRRKGRELPIQYLALNAFHFSHKPMIAVSDDPISFEFWKRFYPQTTLVSKLSLENSFAGGNHMAPKEKLNVTKHQLNIDMLNDFIALASCEQILSTYKDSRFLNEARRLGPFLKTILRNE